MTAPTRKKAKTSTRVIFRNSVFLRKSYLYSYRIDHPMLRFLLNNQLIETAQPPGTVVLDFVRYHQHLTGTKIGCREGDCGACTVLVGELKDGKLQYQSMTSCLMPLANAHGKHIVTVEGINLPGLSPVQQAVVEEGGTQCGFCTPGFVMSLTGFCMSQKEPSYNNAVAAMDGNICRCTGYKSLERAAAAITQQLQARPQENHLSWLAGNGFLPEYFANVNEQMQQLQELIEADISEKMQGQVYVGGGTDLFVQRPEEMAHTQVRTLFGNSELKGIWQVDGKVFLGGGSTVEDLRQSDLMQELFPRLQQFTRLVSSTPIRNMATLAGNFINASPIGDFTIFFLALDSNIILELNGNRRELKLRELYKGYKTLDKQPDEKVTAVYFEVPGSSTHFNFEKVSKRTHLDIASVNSALQIQVSGNTITKAHFAAGGVGPVPFYLPRTSAYFSGKELHAQTLKEANELAQQEISPISDARGSETYKRLLLRQLLYAHFITLFPEQVKEGDLL